MSEFQKLKLKKMKPQQTSLKTQRQSVAVYERLYDKQKPQATPKNQMTKQTLNEFSKNFNTKRKPVNKVKKKK